jgi:hypothetical protein
MTLSPKTITITETAPASVAQYRISARELDGTTELCAALYPITPTGITVIPIGTNGFFAPIADPEGKQVRIFVNSIAVAGHGDNVDQEAPDGPFTLAVLDDGAESIVVEV